MCIRDSGAAIREIVVECVLEALISKNNFGARGVELTVLFAECEISADIDFAGPPVHWLLDHRRSHTSGRCGTRHRGRFALRRFGDSGWLAPGNLAGLKDH